MGVGDQKALQKQKKGVEALGTANTALGGAVRQQLVDLAGKDGSDELFKKKEATMFRNLQTGGLINALAQKLDNTLMGQYIRTKLEAFQASDELCKAAKACSEGKSGLAGKPHSLEKMFEGKGTHDGYTNP